MADAIVTTLLNTGLRVDELVSLMWSDLVLQPRSGKAFIKRGKGEKARIVPLNATVREAFSVIRPVVAEGPGFPRQARAIHGSRYSKPAGSARSSRRCRACSPASVPP